MTCEKSIDIRSSSSYRWRLPRAGRLRRSAAAFWCRALNGAQSSNHWRTKSRRLEMSLLEACGHGFAAHADDLVRYHARL